MKRNMFSGVFSKVLLATIFAFQFHFVLSQDYVLFTITSVPEYTPVEDTLYLTGTLNNWKLADLNYRFKRLSDGSYKLNVKVEDTNGFSFKINRGNWEAVEGNDVGGYLPDHEFAYADSVYEHNIIIRSWQDLHKKYFPAITIIVSSLPKNTPKDSKIYVGGSFNGWSSQDPEYQLKKAADGTYYTEIYSGLESFEYKFCRGDWESVEARWDGGVRSNREYIAKEESTNQIRTEIKSWEDLSNGLLFWRFIYIVLFIQAVLVLIVIITLKQAKSLIWLLSVLVFTFVLRFFYNSSLSFNLLPQGQLLTSVILAFFMPLAYTGIRKLSGSKPLKFSMSYILPFLPIVVLIYLWRIPYDEFRLKVLSNEYNIYILVIYLYSIVLNIYYLNRITLLLKRTKFRLPQIIQRLIIASKVIFILSLLLLIAVLIATRFSIDIKTLSDWFENIVWSLFGAIIIYAQILYLIEAHKIINYTKSRESKAYLTDENLNSLKQKLITLMESKRIYANPQLTLSDLAASLGTNTYYVSKLINESFNMSFTDYINGYRIKVFIEEFKSSPDKNKSFLYLAHKVGFNSKSAFNRAFKKVTQKTPSDYFLSNN